MNINRFQELKHIHLMGGSEGCTLIFTREATDDPREYLENAKDNDVLFFRIPSRDVLSFATTVVRAHPKAANNLLVEMDSLVEALKGRKPKGEDNGENTR